MKNLTRAVFESPVGPLTILASEDGIHALLFSNESKKYRQIPEDPRHPLIVKATRQLKEYFSGKRKEFDLPLKPEGSDFQMKAWRELRRIPFGKTISYAQQAERVGDRKKARAVGQANGRNPIGIFIPCHRVISASGALNGFGGGVKVKEFLLNLERAATN